LKPTSKNLIDWLRWGKDSLKNAGISSANLDAALLLAHSTGQTKTQIFVARPDEFFSEFELNTFSDLIEKRAKHTPVAYLTGKCEFMGLEFEVNKHVLIPRPETELLAENAMLYKNAKTVLELCTGSGCVAVSLSKLTNFEIDASDISLKVLGIAKINAAKHNASVKFFQSDMFHDLPNKRYDMILANPPYIAKKEIERLPISVKKFEPTSSLDGGEDGLFFYSRIVDRAADFLNAKGVIMLEIGYDQAEAVKGLLAKDFENVQIKKDLSGRDRLVIASMRQI
jgi:release factor glutamine methyltransferase